MKLPAPGKSRWERMRTRLSKVKGLLLLLTAGITQSNWELHHDAFATFLYALGLVFVAIVCFGRIGCSFNLSGRKDSVHNAEGPYSLSRNPLYFCSALGVIGIGLCTETLFFPLLFGVIFAIYCPAIIRREGIRLQEMFGEAYDKYVQDIPAFFPLPAFLRAPAVAGQSCPLSTPHHQRYGFHLPGCAP